MSESLLISFEEAGRLLGGLHPNTLRQRKGGTENFTHVAKIPRPAAIAKVKIIETISPIRHAEGGRGLS